MNRLLTLSGFALSVGLLGYLAWGTGGAEPPLEPLEPPAGATVWQKPTENGSTAVAAQGDAAVAYPDFAIATDVPPRRGASPPVLPAALQRPPRIADQYRPLLPFTVGDAAKRLVPVQPRSAHAAAPAQFHVHTVRPGDTLQTIAREYYGSADRYLEIYAANRDVLAEPSHLPGGATLKIPQP